MTQSKNINLDRAEISGEAENNAGIENFPVLKITQDGGGSDIEEAVAREMPVTIIVNDEELVTMLCYPIDLKYMVVGFLASEGLINKKEDIKLVTIDDKRGVARITTNVKPEVGPDVIFKRVISSGCGRGASFYTAADLSSLKVTSDLKISAAAIFSLVSEFQHASRLYIATHGIHAAALCDSKSVVVFAEDIGRHNAIDKIFGKCLLEDIPTRDRLIVTSGRITSEILHKVARRQIPMLISISAPTNLGVRIADTLGITLVASVRGRKMSVFTHKGRVEG